MTRLRILLVDDHETMRAGLKALIHFEPDLEVTGEARDGEQALECVRSHDYDVVVMDVSMPGMGGLVATRRLKEMRPQLAIVSLTRHGEKAFVQGVLDAGALGYVLKQSPYAGLIRAIRLAAAGEQYVDPSLLHLIVPQFITARRRAHPGGPVPTERECEVLRLIAQGHSNKQTATLLDLSVKTIEAHKANGMQKLGLNGRIDLMQYALHQGWLHETANRQTT